MRYIIAGIGIVAAIIGTFDLNLVMKILVAVIIVACFVGVLLAVSNKK